MAVTVKTLTSIITDYELIQEEKSLITGFNLEKSRTGEAKEGNPSFISDNPKIFLKFPKSFYHCMYDFLGTLFHLYEIDSNILFIIDSGEAKKSPSSSKLVDFCMSVLDYHKVKYQEVDLHGTKEININNFYVQGKNHLDHNAQNLVFKYFLPFVKDPSIKPFRKVYISRSYINQIKKKFYGDGVSSRLSRQEYSRLKDEVKLEEYFASHGFDVVIPEKFESFQDQLNFFYEVKTAVAVTGGGLTNTLFMQDGGIVVELMTTLITEANGVGVEPKDKYFEEAQHHFYHSIAFNKNHLYVGLKNVERNPDTIINYFETDKILKAVFEQDNYE
jgi:hypothetical protein